MKIFWPLRRQPSPSLLGARLERARVGARPGLGQRVAAELLAGREAGEEARTLLVRCPSARPTLAVEAVRDGDDPAHVRVGPTELLDDERVRDVIGEPHARRAPRAAPLRGSRATTSLSTIPRSIVSARSHSAANGAISASQNSRAVRRISCCSSVSSKSMLLPGPKKSRRVGGAFVHLTDRPLGACAFGSHSAGLRPTRAPHSTGAAEYVAVPGRARVCAHEIGAHSEISAIASAIARSAAACRATSACSRHRRVSRPPRRPGAVAPDARPSGGAPRRDPAAGSIVTRFCEAISSTRRRLRIASLGDDANAMSRSVTTPISRSSVDDRREPGVLTAHQLGRVDDGVSRLDGARPHAHQLFDRVPWQA